MDERNRGLGEESEGGEEEWEEEKSDVKCENGKT